MELANQDYTKWALPPGAISRIGKGQINDVKFSPDGKLLVVASSVGIWLYDAETGVELDLLMEHTGSVDVLAFSPDGRTFASGSKDTTICLWDITTSHLLCKFRGHVGYVFTLAFSPDGTKLASGGPKPSDEVRLWDVHAGKELTSLPRYIGSVKALTYSPDGKTLVICPIESNATYLLDPYTGSVRSIHFRESQFPYSIKALSYSPDGKTLAVESSNHTIWLGDPKTCQCRVTLKGHSNSINSVAFSPNGKKLASAGKDGVIHMWDTRTGVKLVTLAGHTDFVNAVSYSPNGSTLVSGGNDGTLRFWDAEKGHELFAITGHTKESTGAITFSSGGETLANGSIHLDKTINLLDVHTGKEISTSAKRPVPINALAFSANGGILASGSYQEIHLWKASTGNLLSTLGGYTNSSKTWKFFYKIFNFTPRSGHLDWVRALAFSPNGHILASGGQDKMIRLWDLPTGAEICFSGEHEDWVNTLSFSSNSCLLASGSKDGRIKIWDTRDLFTRVNSNKEALKPNMNCEVSTLGRHGDGVRVLSFSSDDSVLASGCEDGTIQLWDVSSNSPISTLVGHTGWVYAFMFLCNDDVLVSGGGGDNTIRFWDTFTGQEIRSLTGHTAPVRTLAFLSDSKILVSAGNDGTIYLWDWKKLMPSET